MPNLLVLVAVVLNASYAPVLYFAMQRLDFYVFALLIQSFAALSVVVINHFAYGLRKTFQLLRLLQRKTVVKLVFAAVFFAAFNLALMFAVQNSNPVDVNLIGEAWPVSLFLALIFMRRQFSLLDINSAMGVTLGCAGALLIAWGTYSVSSISFVVESGLLAAIAAAVLGGLNSAFLIWAADDIEKIFRASSMVSLKRQMFIALSLEMINRLLVASMLGVVWLIFPAKVSLSLETLVLVGYAGLFVTVIQSVLWTAALTADKDPYLSVLAYLSPLFSAVALAIFASQEIKIISLFGGLIVIFANIVTKTRAAERTLTRRFALPVFFMTSLFCLATDPVLGFSQKTVDSSSLGLIFSIIVGFSIADAYAMTRRQRERLSELYVLFSRGSIKVARESFPFERLRDISSPFELFDIVELFSKSGADPHSVDRARLLSAHYVEAATSKKEYSQMIVCWLIGIAFVIWEVGFRDANFYGDLRAIIIASSVFLILFNLKSILDQEHIPRDIYSVVVQRTEVQKFDKELFLQIGIAFVALFACVRLLMNKYGL